MNYKLCAVLNQSNRTAQQRTVIEQNERQKGRVESSEGGRSSKKMLSVGNKDESTLPSLKTPARRTET